MTLRSFGNGLSVKIKMAKLFIFLIFNFNKNHFRHLLHIYLIEVIKMVIRIQSVNHMNAFLLPNSIRPQAAHYNVFQADDGVILFIPVKDISE